MPISVLGLLGLGLGIWLGSIYPDQLSFIGSGVLAVFGFIGDNAPYIIFLTLTPAIGGMLRTGSAAKFAGAVLLAMLLSTFLAAFYGILVAMPFLSIPLGTAEGGLGSVLGEIGRQMGEFALTSQLFLAIWYSIIVALLLYFGEKRRATAWFCRPTARVYHWIGVTFVERYVGRALTTLFPLLLFAIGVFVPTRAAESIQEAQAAAEGGGFSVWGSTDPVTWYVFTVVLVAVAGIGWLLMVGYAVCRYTKLPFKRFLGQYLFYVYGMSWGTASSVASIPVNLDRTRSALGARSEVRDFVIPLGATVNLDGTIMAAFLIMPVAAYLVGFQVTLVHMLMVLLPLVVVSIGVPGIQGGMAIVTPPVILALVPGIPNPEVFSAIFLALGVGLTDQFRTGVNTCDNGLICRLFEHWYPKHFAKDRGLANGAGDAVPA